MYHLIDLLEEHCWLEKMEEEGLLNELGLMRLRKYERKIEELSAIAGAQQEVDDEA